jgi:hypothetical protein
MGLFTKLIRCGRCQSNFRRKIEKGKVKYICGLYHKDSSACVRIAVEESYLMELLSRRIEGELTRDKLLEEVDYVEVFDKKKGKEEDVYFLTIHMKNQENIILADGYIQL